MSSVVDRSFLAKYQVGLTNFHAPSSNGASEEHLGWDYEPNNFDVISGKGRNFYNHVGNRRFRVTLSLYMQKYIKAPTKATKSCVVNEIVECIHESNGRFIRRAANHEWIALSDDMARDKAGHAIRAAITSNEKKRRSSSCKESAKKEQQPVPTKTLHVKVASAGDEEHYRAIFGISSPPLVRSARSA